MEEQVSKVIETKDTEFDLEKEGDKVNGGNKLSPDHSGPITVAAYSYMSLVPVIKPPISSKTEI